MDDFRADLHTHSRVSDGSCSVRELVALAQAAGLQGLALSDHDSVEGVEEGFEEARQVGLCFLSGVELSASHRGHSVHILGYGIDPKSCSLTAFLAHQLQQRRARNLLILERLASYGMILEPIALDREASAVGRVHIAQAMVKAGYVEGLREAFTRWIGDRAPCYVSGCMPEPGVSIQQIHRAGGKALLAHPHLMPRRLALKLIKEFAWDGLEAYYGRFPRQLQREWVQIAERKGLVISGGSDFHGQVKPEHRLGSSWVDRTGFERLVAGTYWQSRLTGAA